MTEKLDRLFVPLTAQAFDIPGDPTLDEIRAAIGAVDRDQQVVAFKVFLDDGTARQGAREGQEKET